jgi:hypothetical protein
MNKSARLGRLIRNSMLIKACAKLQYFTQFE